MANFPKPKPSHQESKWQVEFKRNLFGQEIERNLTGGITSTWERDKSGRPKVHRISVEEQQVAYRKYSWDVNDRLQAIADEVANDFVAFDHDAFGNLAAAKYKDGSWEYKLPDAVGNLFKSPTRTDRSYGKAGQLLKDETYTYSYDAVGNLIKKESLTEKWQYSWFANGMLKAVHRPDNTWVRFTYDALGRRLTKTHNDLTTHYVWDGNVLLHEWTQHKDETLTHVDDKGEITQEIPEDIITWIFEEGSFVPMAKLHKGKSYSILTDHLGTPQEAYDEEGKKVWQCQLDIYGKVRSLQGDQTFIPFRYQGQYEDEETGLYYNRFRYYSPDSGIYITQDPIGLEGGMPNMYAYTHDSNTWIDSFGLSTYNPITWTALGVSSGGTGNTYKIFQQDIDWDLPVNTRNGIKTNLELAEMGRTPFVVKDGKYSQINLHHSKQNAQGPLFEISRKTHEKFGYSNALHPYKKAGNKPHPHFPVDRDAFDIDRDQYWKDRAAAEKSKRLKLKGCN